MQEIKTFEGEFEIKGQPATKRTGELKIQENGGFLLHVCGAFREGLKIYEPTIVGTIDNGQVISFLKLGYRSKSTVMTRGQSSLSGGIAVIGDKAIADTNELKLKQVRFKLFDCNVWFCEDHLNASQQNVSPLYYKVELKYDENTDISIESKHDFSQGKRFTYITIKSKETNDLSYFQDAIYQLVTFISFAIAKAVKQGYITAIDEHDEEYEIYYQPSFYPIENSVGTSPVLFFHHFPRLQQMFDRWGMIIQRKDLKVLIPLYFLPFLNKVDVTVRFILRTQLIESLHRKLTDNSEIEVEIEDCSSCGATRTKKRELFFVERVKDVIEHSAYRELITRKLIREQQIEPLCQLIKKTRNYYTHYDNDQNIAQGGDLIFLCIRAELLIDLFLLQHLGFEKVDFEEIASWVITDRFNRQKIMEEYE